MPYYKDIEIHQRFDCFFQKYTLQKFDFIKLAVSLDFIEHSCPKYFFSYHFAFSNK